MEVICMRCGGKSEHSEKHEAYYCPQCNEWLEPKCGDLAGDPCCYCSSRPEHPLPDETERLSSGSLRGVEMNLEAK